MKKAMALLLACSMVLAFAACSKKQYTEQEVTAVVDVTDENGKTVTDKDGKAQTRVVTIPQTDAKGNTVAAGESAADGQIRRQRRFGCKGRQGQDGKGNQEERNHHEKDHDYHNHRGRQSKNSHFRFSACRHRYPHGQAAHYH